MPKKNESEINDTLPPGELDQAEGLGNAPGYDPDDLPGVGLDRGDIFLDEKGRERPDPTPMAPPVGYKRQPTMVEIIRQQVRSQALAAAAEAAGMDTWEEADDFDVGDDFDPGSPWEERFDPIGYAPGALQDHERRFQAAQAAKPPSSPAEGAPAPSGGPAGPTSSAAKPSVNEPSAASSTAKP